ncbi:Piso0_002378 [Millerozyma farinosa CBS 7064]|uniref:Piso0_002378 protein n=1 Tax=Pichia sorbitophila (strain ATCC MYA-4447 / BCRC 22081 / CBS 7064 / NBRC 10061 / NRRL Y-12695) TaxID=559304 RepID=G8YEW4_PICSO|nr:Piso0_002378 [Millerozyma farinosa CBS 7064]
MAPISEKEIPFESGKGYKADKVGVENIAKGFEHPHKIPSFTSAVDERKWVLEHMAGAFRIFGRYGYAAGSAGHISVKDPVEEGTFWINPLNKHFSLMKVSDLVHIDEQCNVLKDGNQAAVNAAGFFIHAALHRARPDVKAICHTHSIHGKAFSGFGKKLDMVNQDVCILYKRHSVYKDFGGVAYDEKEGEEIVDALEPGSVAMILQNHGLLTLGSTVDEAAALFILTENSCQAQLLMDAATASGKKKQIIPDDVAEYTCKTTGDPESMYAEFQPDYELELELTNGAFLK